MKTTITKVAKIAGISAVAGIATVGAFTIALNVIDQVKQRGKNRYERSFNNFAEAREEHYEASMEVCDAVKAKIDEGNALVVVPVFDLNKKMDNMFVLGAINADYDKEEEYKHFLRDTKVTLAAGKYDGPVIIQSAHGNALLDDMGEWDEEEILNQISKKRIVEQQEFLSNLFKGCCIAEEYVAGASGAESGVCDTCEEDCPVCGCLKCECAECDEAKEEEEPHSGELYPGEFDEPGETNNEANEEGICPHCGKPKHPFTDCNC